MLPKPLVKPVISQRDRFIAQGLIKPNAETPLMTPEQVAAWRDRLVAAGCIKVASTTACAYGEDGRCYYFEQLPVELPEPLNVVPNDV